MTDVFSKKKRSEIMSLVKGGRNRATEGRLADVLRKNRLVGWRRNFPLFGRPDFAFPGDRLLIFVDGCFWHGCSVHGQIPASNRQFWATKLAKNRARDRLVNRTLKSKGWRVLRIWQHEMKSPERAIKRILRVLERPD